MADFGYVLLMIGLTALAALFAIACDKIIGPDDAALAGEDRDETEPERDKTRT